MVLRVAATVAYRPGLMLIGDSYDYVYWANRLQPGRWHPLGYSAFLRLLLWTDRTMAVVIVQHLLGLALGVGTYLLLQRLGVRRWVSALGAAPVLLDAYQVNVEQFLLAETLFEALALGGLALVLARRVSTARAVTGGVLLSAATLTRTVGAAVLVVGVVLLVIRGVGWRRVLVLTGAAVMPLVGYAVWFQAGHGSFGLTSYDGRWFYGKVAPFARCHPASTPPLCPAEPLGSRLRPTFYTWSRDSPFARLHPPAGQTRDQVAQRWALAVVAAQPGDYARAVGSDLAQYSSPGRTSRPADWPAGSWRFQTRTDPARWMVVLGPGRLSQATRAPDSTTVPPQPAAWPAAVLRGYQHVGFLPGPLLAAGALLALTGALLAGRPGDPRRRAAAGLAAGGLGLCVAAAMTVTLDVRYLLPVLVLLAPAGALGLDLWLPSAAPKSAPAPSDGAKRPESPFMVGHY